MGLLQDVHGQVERVDQRQDEEAEIHAVSQTLAVEDQRAENVRWDADEQECGKEDVVDCGDNELVRIVHYADAFVLPHRCFVRYEQCVQICASDTALIYQLRSSRVIWEVKGK